MKKNKVIAIAGGLLIFVTLVFTLGIILYNHMAVPTEKTDVFSATEKNIKTSGNWTFISLKSIFDLESFSEILDGFEKKHPELHVEDLWFV